MAIESEKEIEVEMKKSSGGYGGFAIKVVIVTIAISLGVIFVIDSIVETITSAMTSVDTQSLKTRLQNAVREEKTRVRLKGLLTNNPAVHLRVSIMEEEKGNIPTAIEEIELAIGLLELHSADRAAKDRYVARLQELKRKLPPAQPSKPAPR